MNNTTNTNNLTSIIEDVVTAESQEQAETTLQEYIDQGAITEEQIVKFFSQLKARGVKGNAASLGKLISKVKSGEIGKSVRKTEQLVLGVTVHGTKKLIKGTRSFFKEFKDGFKEGYTK